MKPLAAVLAGAALLAWHALVNGYPLVFSDTAGIAAMGLVPEMGWDKPWVYGPLIMLLHGGVSLWGVVAAQVLLVSALLWLAEQAAGPMGAAAHVLLCALLAAASAAPWFATFVMPDIFAPMTVLCVFLLGWGRLPGRLAAAVTALAAIAIASHLTHLVIAAGCLLAVLMGRWRRLLPCAVPLVLALAWLVGSNVVGNGVAAVSPYGAVFALARLQADGPAADTIKRVCPASGDRVCGWADQLPMDSDAFLWSPDGPVWGHNSGPILFAPEAARIVSETLRSEPWRVARDAGLNGWRQLARAALGDTLGPQYLVETVGLLLQTYFPAAERERFMASRQVEGTLQAVAAPLAGLQAVCLIAGAFGSVMLIPFTWRRRPALAGLASTVLLGVVANAFATGALSGPHDRYGARIAWLILIPPALWAFQLFRPGRSAA